MSTPPVPTTSTTSTTSTTAPAPASTRRLPRSVVISTWAVPLMVLGQFALLAAVPVALLVTRVLRDPDLRRLRRPALLLAASWTIPLAVWVLRPEPADSLSKDISPVFVALVLAASAGMLASLRRAR